MNFKLSSLRSLAVAALVLVSGASQATLAVYTTLSEFTSAVGANAIGTDTFDTGPIDSTANMINRAVNGYSYTASVIAGSSSGGHTFYPAGSSPDIWLTTDTAGDTISFAPFGRGVNAIGGLFFGSDVSGNFLSGQSIDLVVTYTDINRLETTTFSEKITETNTGSFRGFVSDGWITSLTVTGVPYVSGNWAAVNDLVLAGPTNEIPEPTTIPLMLAALGVLGFMAKRRQA